MLTWIDVERAVTPAGNEFALVRRGDDWAIRVDGRMLMSSTMHNSEEELAERGISLADDPRTVLVGGLGLGFTLRAVLDRMPEDAEITVGELVPEIVEWNRTHLSALNGGALADSRCKVVVGDIYDTIRNARGKFDVVLLDVDNGPQSLTQAKNQRLYVDAGRRACHAALTPGGVLAVWAVGKNAPYRRKLESFGFMVEEQRVPAREGSRASHVIFLAQRT